MINNNMTNHEVIVDVHPAIEGYGHWYMILMWAYPLRKAKRANKAKMPYDNHAKPL